MNYKPALIAIPVVVASVLYVLTGGPTDESTSVTPSASGEIISQQISRQGLAQSLGRAAGFETFGPVNSERSFHSDVEFFETVLSYGTNTDPRNTFVLVNSYLTTNQQARGIAFFERLLQRYQNNMVAGTRANYLAAYAILRATYANEVPLISRIGWMNKTFDLLKEAKDLSKDRDPLVHWASGLIYAQVPFFFFKKQDAYTELNWLADRPQSEPLSGFYREVYHHLAKLHASDGNDKLAGAYLNKSGYTDYTPKSLFMGWFTTTRKAGTTMWATPALEEVIPNRVFALYGFGFSNVFFLVSDDGKETIAIDAGTQPASLKAAHEFLLARHPDLPPVTTVIATHAHWDHIGGLTYLKSLNPNLKVYGRENFAGTLNRVQRNHIYKNFRSAGFDHKWVENYKPDIAVDQHSNVTIAGSLIELIPAKGGETEDTLLVHIPALGVIFVGDILMPYYGEPWVEEGFIDGAIATMDKVIARKPKHILHGHNQLTILYGPKEIKRYRDAYKWLVETTRKHISNGYSVKDILRLNLIPAGLQDHPDIFLSYFAAREHVIARVGDHMVGIWQEDITGKEPGGLYNLTSKEYGRLLAVYLDLSSQEVASALRKMIKNGDNELALHLAVAAQKRYANDKPIKQLKEQAADRLRSAAQFFDPFKFVTYSEMIGKEHKPIPAQPVKK